MGTPGLAVAGIITSGSESKNKVRLRRVAGVQNRLLTKEDEKLPFAQHRVMRTTEEALLCVPDMYREGSFGLGAGKLRTIFKIVLPTAIPGILSGIILAIGRIVGETAALIYTAGTVAEAAGVMDSGRTLAIHMYSLSREGLHTNEAYATAVVLLIVVLLINGLSSLIARKLEAATK